jgi:5-oxoprolinase (ATP-hydrolysing) subunit A
MRVDLNADVGEGGPHDQPLMKLISSASIACGGHAGDALSMRDTAALALSAGVAIGAHPGFPDRGSFGRAALRAEPADVHAQVLCQVGALSAIVQAQGGRLSHVKPHGALYNQAATDPALADAIAAAVRSVDPALALFGLAGSAMIAAATRAGLRAVSEAFADRAYRSDGTLVPRDEPGALITDPSEAGRRALAIARDRLAMAIDGTRVQVHADTICLHGDSPGADLIAASIHRALAAAGIEIRAP